MFYQLKAYIPTKFIGHVTWSGNIPKNDASITLHDVQFRFNGTYSCQVRNPPDVHGFAGEVNLQVVQSGEASFQTGKGFALLGLGVHTVCAQKVKEISLQKSKK